MKSAKSYNNNTTGCGHRRLVIIAVMPCLVSCLLLRSTTADSLCDGCLNGGKLLMPNNIFGYCRCRCFGDYKGPKCQFLYKRSSPHVGNYLSSAAVDETGDRTSGWQVPQSIAQRLEQAALPGREGQQAGKEESMRGLLEKLSLFARNDDSRNDDSRDLVSY